MERVKRTFSSQNEQLKVTFASCDNMYISDLFCKYFGRWQTKPIIVGELTLDVGESTSHVGRRTDTKAKRPVTAVYCFVISLSSHTKHV